jgi:hypothetical protein
MLKTPSTARRATLFAATVLAAYAVGAAVANAGVTAIDAGPANYTPQIGDPTLYPNPKDPGGANSYPSVYNDHTGTSNSVGSDPKAAMVPEPAAWVLMAFGFAGLGFAAYRMKRRPALI